MQGSNRLRIVYCVLNPFRMAHESDIVHDIEREINQAKINVTIHNTKIYYQECTHTDIVFAALLTGDIQTPITLNLNGGVLKVFDEQRIFKSPFLNENTAGLSETARRKRIRKLNNRILTTKNWKQFLSKSKAISGKYTTKQNTVIHPQIEQSRINHSCTF